MAENETKSEDSGDPSPKTVQVSIQESHIEAERDIEIIGIKTTHINERSLTPTEEDRQATEFAIKDLAAGVATYLESLKVALAEAPKGTMPYRGLLDYNLHHSTLFFGRDAAIQRFLQKLDQHNFTVLHAASGAGKSSLLKAGIVPRLIADGHLPIYSRPSQDPVLAIKRALLPTVDQIPKLLNSTLNSFLWQVRNSGSVSRTTRIYIFLDQFEEFFTDLGDETQERFLEQLAECLDDNQLNVHWVLALRKEYLSDLTDFQSHIKNPLGNEFRLNFLAREETRDVITQPAARQGVKYAANLTTKLLDDLAQTNFYPPHIQLVCHTLYEARPKDAATITLALYQAHGETVGILQDYLDRVLQSLPSAERALARRVLEFLITSEDRRVARTIPDLKAEFVTNDQQAEILDNLLRQLVNSHLLRQVEVIEAEQILPAYELAHDYLIEKVNVDPEVKARKAVKEMLAQEVRIYQQHDTLLSRDKLEFIESLLDPAEIHNDAKELMLISAIALDYNIDFWWAAVLPETRMRVLSKGLGNKMVGTRQRAAALVPDSVVNPAQIETLAGLMRADPDLSVRQSAALSLAKVDNARFNNQLQQMHEEAATFPIRALEAMAYVQDESPANLNLDQLPGSSWLTTWQMRGLRISRSWRRIGFTTLYAGLGGALGAAIGGFIGASGLSNQIILTIYAFFNGLVVGSSVGFGYGLAKVMDKHLSLTGYVNSAALTGGLLTALFAVSDEARGLYFFILSGSLGIVNGGLGGMIIALITRVTQLRIRKSRRRQLIRLELSVLVGALSGLILVWADHIRIFPPNPDYPSYGFLIGLLTVPGIIVVGLGWWNKT